MQFRSSIALAIAASAAMALPAAVTAKSDKSDKKDPVVMNVAGKDVRLSEFEYLYHKNAAQQVEPQTLDEYVDMFVNYKLKVAAAEAAGIDTTAAFVKEFEGYRDEIAAPYLTDKAMADSLRQAAMSHFADNVDVSHIMFAPGTPQATVDSVYTALKGGADFTSLARRYSADQGTASRGGRMGVITAGRYPYSFEDAAWSTAVGDVSEPVQTQFGTHIIRVNDRRKDPGQILCRHILLMTEGLDEEAKAAKRAKADSILQVVRTGADFAEVARANTDEPAGKRSGGELPWFGPGMMIPDFEAAALALQPGEISDIVPTRFGYHIIKCEDRRDAAPVEEREKTVEAMMQYDGRDKLPAKRFLAGFAASHPELKGASDEEIRRAAIEALKDSHPEYRNLLAEYRDGMLLYEISTREVWGRAAADTAGLRQFFDAHRDRYTWDTPRYKGFILVAATDSLGRAAESWLRAAADTIAPAGYSRALRREFGSEVRIERVLAAKGDNAIVDNLIFDGPTPEPNPKWHFYAPFAGRIISAPEEPADVSGPVSTDYQKSLEDAWLADLHRRFPVKINRKVLKKVSKN